MSESWDRMMARLEKVERAVSRVADRPTGPHMEQRVGRLLRQVEKLELTEPTPARLGTICAGQPVLGYGTFTFPPSYATDGVDFTTLVDVPGLAHVIFGSATGYTFQFDGGTSKVKAYTTATVEVTPLSDLSPLGPIPYIAVGVTPAERLIHRARASSVLHSVGLTVGSAHTGGTSNYWTATLVLHRTDGARVELGDPLVLASRSLAADTLVTIYAPDVPLALTEGDTIHVELAQTGSPNHLDDLTAWVDTRRRTA